MIVSPAVPLPLNRGWDSGNLIGINRISVAVSYADNAGAAGARVSMVIVKSVEKGVVLPLLSLAVTAACRCRPPVARPWCRRSPDAGITDDTSAIRAILIQVHQEPGSPAVPLIVGVLSLVSPRCAIATENTGALPVMKVITGCCGGGDCVSTTVSK